MSAEDSSDSSSELRGDETPDNETRARELLARGRRLNAGTNFSQEAFDLLTKAIKLDPCLIDNWIELTKCYQRKSDIDGAIACLENALKFSDESNKIILRQLSTCLRQKNCESQEAKIAALLRSMELAKQALRADLNDEENYYNLSKAYMCLFFATECVDHQIINLSRAAYSKALSLSNENRAKLAKRQQEKDTGDFCDSNDNPKNGESDGDELASRLSNMLFEEDSKPFIEQSDFLYNYSTVLVYFQEFDKALEYLRLAFKLDPEWDEPKLLEECLVDYLKQIQSILNELGKNAKRVIRKYGKIVESLKSCDKIEAAILADQQRLKSSQEISIKSVTLGDLESEAQTIEGTPKNSVDKNTHKDENLVRLLHLKLVCTINYNQAMYLTFIAIDQNYSLTVVTIYNLAASRCPSPKDVVTIVDPKVDQITANLSNDSKSIVDYKRIDAREFKGFYVNGHRISLDQVSKPQFRISVLP